MHTTLNLNLFHEGPDGIYQLNESVRPALLSISEAFQKYLKEDNIELSIADIRIVGSNAGFDYTSDSDIDLHIVADLEASTCDVAVLQLLLNKERKSFNDTYKPTYKDIPVELYVEDIKSSAESNGIYSLLSDCWVKYPSIENESQKDISEYESTLKVIQLLIDNTMNSDKIDLIQTLINRLYIMRRDGLQRDGRSSVGNQVFKALRNNGYISKLISKRDDLMSKQLKFEKEIQ